MLPYVLDLDHDIGVVSTLLYQHMLTHGYFKPGHGNQYFHSLLVTSHKSNSRFRLYILLARVVESVLCVQILA